jgi:hypothetical protein
MATPASQPSNRSSSALCLAARNVGASFAPWDGERFSNGELSRRDIIAPFFSMLGCGGGQWIDTETLVAEFEADHASEEAFHKKVLERLFDCLTYSRTWRPLMNDSMTKIVLLRRDPDCHTDRIPSYKPFTAELEGTTYEFATGIVRKTLFLERKGSIIDGRPEPDHAWVLYRKKARTTAPGGDGPTTTGARSGLAEADNNSNERAIPTKVAAASDAAAYAAAAAVVGVDGTHCMGERDEASGPKGKDSSTSAATSGVDDDHCCIDDDNAGSGSLAGPRQPRSDRKTSSGVKHRASVDDCRDWEVYRILAAVEFKLHSATPMPFVMKSSQDSSDDDGEEYDETSEGPDGVDPDSISLKHEHGPLAQAVMYALGLVLWDRAVLGLQLPESIPLSAVAIKQESKRRREEDSTHKRKATEKPDSTHWLHGNLIIPKDCGGAFTFNVDAFAMFQSSSGMSALAAYLDVMKDGFAQAEGWLAGLGGGYPPTPRPMTGRELRFGGGSGDLAAASVRFLSSPAAASSSSSGEARFRTSQGELFGGTVDLKAVFDGTAARAAADGRPDRRVHWSRTDFAAGEQRHVLVKVTSLPCYGLLTGDRGFLLQMQGHGAFSPDSARAVLQLLKDSLYGVFLPEGGAGVVQLMPNLLEHGYQQLRPALSLRSPESWTAMWNAFKALVVDVLVPLALRGVVHVDVRPGFDVTANLLFSDRPAKMLLIDLDSLILFDFWVPVSPRGRSKNLILARADPLNPTSALEYVLWQVVCLAETWIAGTCADGVRVHRILRKQKRAAASLTNAARVDAGSISAQLSEYDASFTGQQAAARAAAAREAFPGA